MPSVDPQFVRVSEDWLSESFVYKMSVADLTTALTDVQTHIQTMEFLLYVDDWDSRQKGFINRGLDDWMQAEAIIRQVGLVRSYPDYEYVQPYVDLDRYIVRICEVRGWMTYEKMRQRVKKLKTKSWTAGEVQARLRSLVERGALVKLPPSRRPVGGGGSDRYCTALWLRENHHLENPLHASAPPMPREKV